MRSFVGIFVIISSVLIQGCAAPGSALGRVSINGVVNELNSEGLELKLVLDKNYGMGGPDSYFGTPEDYGYKDKINVVEINEDGKFHGEELDVVYHRTFLLLPPLGGFPKKPPKPYYFLEFSNKKSETYLVGESKNGFDYKVYDKSSRTEIEKYKAYWNIKSGEFVELEKEGQKGWLLTIEIEKYNNSD